MTMDQTNLGYSNKNIPIPSKKSYQLALLDSIEKLIRRVRWKATFTLNPKVTASKKNTYGFNSTKPPKPMSELKEFEDSLMELVKHVEYDRHTNEFLKKLDKDTKQIGEEDRLIIAADKTTNLYKMQPQSYNKLLKEAVQKDYKKSKPNFVSKIIKEDKVVATESDIEDRVQKVTCSEAFITLKDHKENFENNPKVRLINPTKSEVGRISKNFWRM